MGVYIGIKKISEKDNIHNYEVSTGHFDSSDFYISIDASKKQVSFYTMPNFLEPIETVSFKESDLFKEIPGINLAISNRVLIQAYKALEKNEFPQFLSWHT